MLRSGMPTSDDQWIAEGVYWSHGAYGRLDLDVATALTFAYLRAKRQVTSLPPIIITQGAHYTPSPGMAHDGGGVADLRVRHMTAAEKEALIQALVFEGFGVFDLGPPDAGPHLHIILASSPQLNTAAREQLARSRHA